MNADEWAALLVPVFGLMVIFLMVRGPRRAKSQVPSTSVVEPWAMRWRCCDCGDGRILASSIEATPEEKRQGRITPCPACGSTYFNLPRPGRKVREDGKDRWEWRDDHAIKRGDDKKRDDDKAPEPPPVADAAAPVPEAPAPQGKQEVH